MASRHDLQLKAQAWREHQITTHLPAENIRVYDDNFAKCEAPSTCAIPLQEFYLPLFLNSRASSAASDAGLLTIRS